MTITVEYIDKCEDSFSNTTTKDRFFEHLKHHNFIAPDRDVTPYFNMIIDHPDHFFQFKPKQKKNNTQKSTLSAINIALDIQCVKDAFDNERLAAMKDKISEAMCRVSKNDVFPCSASTPIELITDTHIQVVPNPNDAINHTETEHVDSVSNHSDNELDLGIDYHNIDTSDFHVNTGFPDASQTIPVNITQTTIVSQSVEEPATQQVDINNAKTLSNTNTEHVSIEVYLQEVARNNERIKDIKQESYQKHQNSVKFYDDKIKTLTEQLNEKNAALTETKKLLAIANRKNPSALIVNRIKEDYEELFKDLLNLSKLQPELRVTFENTIKRLFKQLSYVGE